MAVVYRIVDRAGGFLHVESEPGRGASIRVYLPRVASGG
jgi:signal transduction histidine kinase